MERGADLVSPTRSTGSGAAPTPFRIQVDTAGDAVDTQLPTRTKEPAPPRPARPLRDAFVDRVEVLPVRIVAFGFRTVPAWLVAVHRSRPQRLIRGFAAMFGCFAVTPLIMLIPPHLESTLIGLGAGVYFGQKYLRGEYVARSLEASCPACGESIAVKPGTTLRLPHPITCYGCHQESWLELDEAGAAGTTPTAPALSA